jgi:hypothetical protein
LNEAALTAEGKGWQRAELPSYSPSQYYFPSLEMQIIPDHLLLYLQLKVLGTSFSVIAYGIVGVLSGNCFYLLQRKRGIHSNRMRIILLIYVTIMFLFSTLSLFQSVCQVIGFMFPPERLPVGLVYLPITLTLTIWGENGFMVRIIIPRQE